MRLLSFVGDDFTGSTDALEVLAMAGIPTVLFLRVPDAALLARHPQARALGVALRTRSLDPAAMREALGPVYAALRAFDAPILQYKVCSTYDSSPDVGSIGLASDLALADSRADWSPAVVGVPRLGRYQLFGHLFAAAGDSVHRLDRHPTMSAHPVTPMAESDLRRHLACQTNRRIGLIDYPSLVGGRGADRLDALRGDDCPIVFLDVIDEASLRAAGELIWTRRGSGLFSASSSGLGYALVAHWRATGLLAPPTALPVAGPSAPVLVLSGSCSPVTAGQIEQAHRAGFAIVPIDPARVIATGSIDEPAERALAHLRAGRSVVAHSATGPDDARVREFDAVARAAGLARGLAQARLAEGLAAIARVAIEGIALTRLVVAGGDSSGAVMAGLGIDALTVKAGFAPGAPLCQAHATASRLDGLEVVLKGGQMGDPSLFVRARDGAAGGA